MYVLPSLSTVQPPNTSTEKSSFLSGIKNFFGRGSTTTTNNPITSSMQQNIGGFSSTSNNVNLTFPTILNQNYERTVNDLRGRTSPQNTYSDPTKTVGTPTSQPIIRTSHSSQYVNQNFLTSPTSQKTEFRDRHNFEKSFAQQFLSSTAGTPTNRPSVNNNGDRRDYVNPNFPVLPTSSQKSEFGDQHKYDKSPTSHSFLSSTVNTPTSRHVMTNNGSCRDYINPNFPILPTSNQRLNSAQNTVTLRPTSIKLSFVSSTTTSIKTSPSSDLVLTNTKDFPPLSPPGSPTRSTPHKSQFTTNQPNRAISIQKTSEPATDDELTTLSETLFSKDTNNQNKNVIINYQGQTRSSDTTDEAPQPLLQVQDEVFQSPTISKMRPLYNNYELDTSINEYVTPMERQEENDFIDAVLKTQVMRHAMLFLQNKSIVSPDPRTHKDLLKTIWFTLYSRGNGRIGSSAFEHVFLNEIKNGTITGLHNWVYYNEQERQGLIDYKGYIKKLDLGNKGVILKYRFDYDGIKKPVNAMFIGTSPELEMALYTICFQVRADKDCPVSVNGSKFNIKTYTFRYRGKNLIGSVFPEI